MTELDKLRAEHHGLQTNARNPVRAALATFVAFAAFGLIPLLPFLVPQLGAPQRFTMSCVLTGLTFVGVGLVKANALERPLARSGLETLLTGAGRRHWFMSSVPGCAPLLVFCERPESDDAGNGSR
jgi:VIT1/CCC1 family predicted Fe2+/Mn2+ transporter